MRTATASETPSLFDIYWKESRYELIKQLRMPMYAIPTLAFPVVFYLLFGILLNPPESGMATYMLATYGAFAVIGTALFGFGVGCAIERGQGWMLLKRASPMPASAYFVAKIVMSVLFGAVAYGLLVATGVAFGGVSLSPLELISLGAVLLAGALPFCALGLVIAYLAGPNSAPAIVNLIYLPVSFASGLWVPYRFLPEVVQKIAHLLPPYHHAQLALQEIGMGEGERPLMHVGVLIGFTLICLGLATYLYLHDEGKTYG